MSSLLYGPDSHLKLKHHVGVVSETRGTLFHELSQLLRKSTFLLFRPGHNPVRELERLVETVSALFDGVCSESQGCRAMGRV